VKYAVTQLLALGYQSRLSFLAAGSYGEAQVIFLSILWRQSEVVVPVEVFSVGSHVGRVHLPSFPSRCSME